jgi:hypothetical protein
MNIKKVNSDMDIQLKQVRLAEPERKPYSLGPYSKCKGDSQWIRISQGCPHNCAWCLEPMEYEYYGIPKIERNDVGILDMNLLAKPEALQTLIDLKDIRVNGAVVRYHMLCGFDYRFLTPELAEAIIEARFYRPKLAWDNHLDQGPRIKAAIKMLTDVGYRKRDILVFVIANHPEVSFREAVNKMLCLAVMGVAVDPCVFDNQIKAPWIPIAWTVDEIEEFQRLTRKLNMIVRHGGIDPEAFTR